MKNRKIKKNHSKTTLNFFQDFKPSKLFERAPPLEYVKEWTEILMKTPHVEEVKDLASVLVFRLGKDWLALSTFYVKEVSHRKKSHQIPHSQNNILLGLVNLNGVLQPYIALDQLLNIEMHSHFNEHLTPQQDRMIAIGQEGELWVFPVDEILGIYHLNLNEMENVPVNLGKSSTNFIKGIMNAKNRIIGFLDHDLLMANLKRSFL